MPKISKGNTKLGKAIPNINLPPITSCVKDAPCKKECYAMKAYRQYKNTRTAWNYNLELYKTSPIEYFIGIDTFLTKKQPRLFRWHSAGDIPDKLYLKLMCELARKHSRIKFLAFTKRYSFFKHVRIPTNLSIVFSAWPGYNMPKSRFPIAFMQDGTETRVKNALECPGNCDSCGMCWELKNINKNVVFNKH